jgi:hypothetical protein
MTLLPFGPPCPLQTILLRDLVGYDSPLKIVMTVWCTFFKNLKHAKQLLLSAAGFHTFKLKEVRQTTIIINSGLSHLTGWAALPSENISRHFSRVEKPS